MNRNEPQGVVKKRTEPHSRKNITEPLNNELPTKRTANEPNRFEPEPDETNRYEPHRQRTESKRAGCRNKPPRTAWTTTNLICARVPICAVGECVCVCVCVCARKRLHRNTHVPTTPARFPFLLPQYQPFVSRICPLFCRPIIMKTYDETWLSRNANEGLMLPRTTDHAVATRVARQYVNAHMWQDRRYIYTRWWEYIIYEDI